MSEIEIKDVDEKSLRLALEYLYGERISMDIDNVQGLMAVSSLLQVRNKASIVTNLTYSV